jgi:hypothetical protein
MKREDCGILKTWRIKQQSKGENNNGVIVDKLFSSLLRRPLKRTTR